ncbi:recombinase family protein [Clostridium butyricum]|uniref:recombinase family protein n=1 Tax=Clostridium butyricum TaxID=1492 RepID=UPI00374FA6E1
MKLNIAVYCRVRTTHPAQLESLSNQIDLIITKSISRFGCNTADTLAIIHRLSLLNIDILFEVENIRISETIKTFLLSIFKAVAQAESEARSQNIKWGIKHGLETGSSKFYDRKCYGYSHDSEGNLVINENESIIVQNIFNLYLSGYSILGIIRELKIHDIKSPTGKDNWAKRTIDTMLSNEKYTGNVLIGKTYCNNFPNNECRINKGECEKYLINDHHIPIITREQFDQVQSEKLRRSNIKIDCAVVKRKQTHYSMKKSFLVSYNNYK